MDNKRYKITPHTSQTVRVEAEKGWHFENMKGDYLGNVIFDALGVRIEDKYRLVQDENEDNQKYLKIFD
jgi:hypothetical protein